MGRHWVPGDDCVPLRAARRPARAPLTAGSKAGLLLVAAVCGGTVLGLNHMFARPDVFAEPAALRPAASLVTQ